MKKLKKHQTKGLVNNKEEYINPLQFLGMEQIDSPIAQPMTEKPYQEILSSIGSEAASGVNEGISQAEKPKNGFNPFMPNNFGLGLMGAYMASSALLNKQNDRNYEAYKNRWLRNYTMPSTLIDPYKHGDTQSEMPIYQRGGRTPIYTDNPNDPRLRAYNDSLNLYNSGQRMEADYQSLKSRRPEIAKKEHRYKYGQNPALDKEFTGKIKPIEILHNDYLHPGRKNDGETDYQWISGNFKKPVQPVVYQKPESQSSSKDYNKKYPPIYVTDPNDPRLRAYNDSLKAYNWGEKTYKKVIDSGLTPSGNPVYSVANRSTLNKSQEIERRLRTYKSMGLNVTKDDILEEMNNLDSINKGTGKKNNAVNFVNFQKKDNEGIYSLHQYKKPVQPVVYQKSQGQTLKNVNAKNNSYTDSLTLSKTTSYLPVKGSDAYAQKEIDDIIKNGRLYGSDIFDDPKVRAAAKRISKTGNEYDVKPMWTKVGDKYMQTFKKPVGTPEPQEPKFEKPIPIPRKTDLVDFSNGRMPTPSAPDLQQAVYDNTKPTNYSYTYYTGKYKNFFNEQKVIYFPDENLLRNFADKQYTTSIQSTGNQATATGTLKTNDNTKPTNYSYTYPTGKYNEQKVIYFPDENLLRNFADKQYTTSIQSTGNQATATGTLKTKKKGMKNGGLTMKTKEDQGMGYFKYPQASSLTFPGKGERTFVPGPFPILLKDDNGTRILKDKPMKTKGKVVEIPLYEKGGDVKRFAKKVSREDATIEAEVGEVIFGAGAPGTLEDQETRVGVGLFKIGGKKHGAGGTPLNAKEGDFVFSDHSSLAFTEEQAKELVGKVIKNKRMRTPAKLASRYLDLNQFLNMTQEDEYDMTSKKTAALNVNNFIDRLAEIAYAQEQLKGFPNGLPTFANVSLSTRGFDVEGLQHSLNNGVFKMGGEIKKYQNAGLVTDDIRKKGVKKEKPDPDYEEYAKVDNQTWYRKKGVPGSGTFSAGKFKDQDIFKMLDLYGNRKTNQVTNLTYDELLKGKAIGVDTPEARKYWNEKYYRPGTEDQFQYTEVFNQAGPVNPLIPKVRPGLTDLPDYQPPSFLDAPERSQNGKELENYVSIPNTKFNVNAAEAFGLYAAARPYGSRYPTAFRNYEISDAEALVSNSYRPISEQPYLNAIKRQTLGFDQNNNPNGAAGYTRSLGAFKGALSASNQAIEGVYNQNISRRDAQMNALAQLRVQNGIDRVANEKEYDTKLETLNNNKELAKKYRDQNVSTLLNQMQKDRESKAMFNQMSEYYQINPDGGFGLKPVYKVKDGKLTKVDRTIGDMISSTRDAGNQYTPLLAMVERLKRANFTEEQISRMMNMNPLK